jgi:WD40 repeat protein
VAFSPDGNLLASAGRDRAPWIWKVPSGGPIGRTPHNELIRSIAFHPDGRTLVSASFDGTIRFWDVIRRGEARGPIRLKGTPANCVVISRDGKTLAANTTSASAVPVGESSKAGRIADPARAITVWDWSSHKELLTMQGCLYPILGLAFSPDGGRAASAGGMFGGKGEVKLWDVATGRLIADLVGHARSVECVAFSPDGKVLVSAGGWAEGPGEIKLWDLKALRQHHEAARE